MTEIIIQYGIKIIFALLSVVVSVLVIPWLKNTIIPYIKELRLYDTVCGFVKAAEKYAQTHDIDKKSWVVELLEGKGIEVNATVDALIEAAVQELDILIEQGKRELKGEEKIGLSE